MIFQREKTTRWNLEKLQPKCTYTLYERKKRIGLYACMFMAPGQGQKREIDGIGKTDEGERDVEKR